MENLPDQNGHDSSQPDVTHAIAEIVARLPEAETIFGLIVEQEMQQAVARHIEQVRQLADWTAQGVNDNVPPSPYPSDEMKGEAGYEQLELALFVGQEEVEARLDDLVGAHYAVAKWLVAHRGQRTYPRSFMADIRGLKRATLEKSLRIIREDLFFGQLLRVGGQKSNRTYGMADDDGRCDMTIEQLSDEPLPDADVNMTERSTTEPTRQPADLLEPSPQFHYALRCRLTTKTVLSDTGLSIQEYEGEKHIYYQRQLIKLQPTTINILHIVALYPKGISFDQLRQLIDQVTRTRHTPAGIIDHLLKIEQNLTPECGWRKFYALGPTGRRELIYKLEGAFRHDVSEWPDFLSSVRPQIMRQQLARWAMQT